MATTGDLISNDLVTKTEQSNGQLIESVESIEMTPLNNIPTVSPDNLLLHIPPACCPRSISKHFDCCKTIVPRTIQRKYVHLRSEALRLVEHRFFEWLIIASILASSTTLVSDEQTKRERIEYLCFSQALEDINTRQKPIYAAVLHSLDKLFTIIFTAELILKWFAHGIKNYFTNGWNWLDFFIVMVSVLGTLLDALGVADIPAFKSMRTLRALRPLKALSRFEGIRVSEEKPSMMKVIEE